MSWTYRYFSSKEFECQCGCGAGSSLDDIDRELLDRLCTVREQYGPMLINSGARCPRHNQVEGGKTRSAHLTVPGETQCRAADIHCPSSISRGTLLPLLIQQFKRVGIAHGFIHVDVAGGPSYPAPTTWLY